MKVVLKLIRPYRFVKTYDSFTFPWLGWLWVWHFYIIKFRCVAPVYEVFVYYKRQKHLPAHPLFTQEGDNQENSRSVIFPGPLKGERDRKREWDTTDVYGKGKGKVSFTFVEVREWSSSTTTVRKTRRTSRYSVSLEKRNVCLFICLCGNCILIQFSYLARGISLIF